MFSKMLLICFAHSSAIESYELFQNVLRGFYSVDFCTVGVPLNNVVGVAAFADVFDDSFDSILVVTRVLFVFTMLLM